MGHTVWERDMNGGNWHDKSERDKSMVLSRQNSLYTCMKLAYKIIKKIIIKSNQLKKEIEKGKLLKWHPD